jgi:hypothetical protein
MRRNEAQRLAPEDQTDGNPVEARIARLESDIGHVKTDVSELRGDMKAANDSLAAIKATIPHLATRADLNEVAGRMATMETKLIRWFVGTALAIGALAFSIAKFMG